MPSIQAGSTKQIIQVELTEQVRTDIVDDIIALAAGYGGAYLTGFTAFLLSRCMTHNFGIINYCAGLGGVASYGVVSRKLAAGKDQQKKMFGRGGLVGTAVAFAQLVLLLFGAIGHNTLN